MYISAPSIESPTTDSTVQAHFRVTGKGVPGAKVAIHLVNHATASGVGIVGWDGKWAVTLELYADPNESYSLTARQFASDGTESGWANAVRFKVVDGSIKTTVSQPPKITYPSNENNKVPVSPTICGTGKPGAKIILGRAGVGDQYGKPAFVDSAGNWSVLLSEACVIGAQYGVTARQYGTDGSTSDWASNVYFTVELSVDAPPVILTPADGNQSTQVCPVVTGTGTPGATVILYQADVGNQYGNPTVVDSFGHWSIPLIEADQGGARYGVTAKQYGTDGSTSDWAKNVYFTLTATGSVHVNVSSPPEILSPVQGDSRTEPCPVVTGNGTPGAKVILYRAGVGTQYGDPAYVDINGHWAIPLNEANVPGEQYGVTAKQFGTDDEQGSSWANNVFFTLGTVGTVVTPSKRNPMGMDPCDSQSDQVFNTTVQKRNMVDPRTGLFEAYVPLPPICGNYGAGPVVDMSLFYSPVVNNTGALGDGWFFSFTFYNKKNKKLSLYSGESITIEPGNDSAHPAVSISWKDENRELWVTRKDGREEQLQELSGTELYAPRQIIDDAGRRLTVDWGTVSHIVGSDTVHQVRLVRVSDPQRVLLNVQYGDGLNSSAVIKYWPDDSSESMRYSLDIVDYALRYVTAPDGTKSAFDYRDHPNCGWLLEKIGTFDGVVEEVNYSDIGLKFKDNPLLSSLPCVVEHRLLPREAVLPVVSHYSYNREADEGYSTKKSQGVNSVVETVYKYDKSHDLIAEVKTQGSAKIVKVYSLDAGARVVTTEYQRGGRAFKVYARNKYEGVGVVDNFQDGVSSYFDYEPSEVESMVVDLSRNIGAGVVYTLLSPDIDDVSTRNLVLAEKVVYSGSYYDHDKINKDESGFKYNFYSYGYFPMPKVSHVVTVNNAASGLGQAALTFMNIDYEETGQYRGRQSEVEYGYIEKDTGYLLTTLLKSYGYDVVGVNLIIKSTDSSADGSLKSVSSKTHSMLSGRLVSQVDEDGNVSEFAYNKVGQLISHTVCAQSSTYKQVSRYAYPYVGRIEITEPNGRQRASEYDGLDNLIREYARDNEHFSWRQMLDVSYDELGRKLRTTRYDYLADGTQLANWEEQLYDDWNEECGVLYSSGLQMFNQFDPIARTRTEWSGTKSDLHGKVTTYNDNKTISKIEWKDETGRVYQTQTYAFTVAGQVKQQVTTGEFGIVTVDYAYDGAGRKLTEKHTESHSGLSYIYHYSYPEDWMITDATTVEIEFDGRRRILGRRQFDALGRVTSLTRGTETETFTYSGSSRVPQTRQNSEGAILRYEYVKELGNRVSKVSDAAGSKQKTFTYAFGNQNASTASEGESLLTFNHDINAQVAAQRSQSGNGVAAEAKSNYSVGGRLLSTTDPVNTNTSYSYTANGMRQKSSDAIVETTHGYDDQGRLASETIAHLASQLTMSVKYTYDAQHRETMRTFISGNLLNLALTRSYFADGSLKATELWQDGALIGSRELTYSEAGRLTSCSTTGVWRPKSLSNKLITRQVFTYDALGNVRTCVTTEDGNPVSRTRTNNYDDASGCALIRVEHSPADSTYPASAYLDYDKAGRVTRDHRGKTYSYDWLGRLAQAGSTYYRYDAQDRLMVSNKDSQARQIFYSGTEVIGDYKGAAQSGDSRYLCPGSSACTVQRIRYSGRDKRELFELRDAQGTVLISYDIQARSFKHHAYTAYGDHFSDETESLLGFNGEYRDSDNDQYPLGQGYRWYAPDSLQFHAQDSLSPFGEGGPQPYGYCDGDPVNIQDPSGHFGAGNVGSGAVNRGLRAIWDDSVPGPLGFGNSKQASLTSTILWTGLGIMTAIMSGGSSLLVTGALVALAVASSATAVASVLLSDTHPQLAAVLGWVSLGAAVFGGAVTLAKKVGQLALYLARSTRAVARELFQKTTDALAPLLRRHGLYRGHFRVYGVAPLVEIGNPFPFSPLNLIRAPGATSLFDFDDAFTVTCLVTGVLGNSGAFEDDEDAALNNNINNLTNVGWKLIRLGRVASSVLFRAAVAARVLGAR